MAALMQLFLLLLSISTGLAFGTDKREGEACHQDFECKSGRCKDHKCFLMDDGGGCGWNENCRSGTCYNHKCVNIGFGGNGEGGFCRYNSDCHSRKCYDDKCVTIAEGGNGEGGVCKYDTDCNSGKCHGARCYTVAKDGNKGGGFCTSDFDCYSETCHDETHKCSPESPVKRKVGDGGYCRSDYSCFSNRCIGNKCAAVKPKEEKPGVGDGVYCTESKDCGSGYCRSLRCAGPMDKVYNISERPCIHHDDCHYGRCSNATRRCHMDEAPNESAPAEKKRGHGRPCAKWYGCVSGECLGKCDSKEPAIGSPCLISSDCEPLKCDNLQCVSGCNSNRWGMSLNWLLVIRALV